MDLILQSVPVDGWLVRVHGLVKIFSAVLFVLVILFTPQNSNSMVIWLAFWNLLIIGFLLHFKSGLISYLKRSALMFLLLTMALPFNAHSNQETALLKLVGLPVFKSGLQLFAFTFLKAMLILTISLTVLVTTPYTVLLASFQKLKLPDWILAILMYMFRLFFLMEQEFVRLQRALKSRSGKLSLRRKLIIVTNFTGVYLGRLMERSERSYLAMMSRGFKGKFEIFNDLPFKTTDLGLIVIPVIYGLGLVLWK